MCICADLPTQLALHPHRRLQCSQCVATGDLALADMAQPAGSGQLDKLLAGICVVTVAAVLFTAACKDCLLLVSMHSWAKGCFDS